MDGRCCQFSDGRTVTVGEVLGEISLPLVPRSVGRGRTFIRAVLGRFHPAMEDVRLLVSEVITSALVYADGGSVKVLVTECGGVVRVDLIDWTARLPPARGEPGWILFLVDLMAARWGVHSDTPAGTVTWFEVDPKLPP